MIRYLMIGGGLVANRGWVEKLGFLFALSDYRPSLNTLTFEGGDLSAVVASVSRRPCTRRHALKANLLTFVERLEFRGVPEL